MNIFRLEIRNLNKGILIWTTILGVIIFLLLAFFPSMQSEGMQEIANAKLESISPGVLAVLGFKQMPDFTVVTNYFGYVLQYLNLAIAMFVMLRGTNALIREETEGTIEYLYVKPVSRINILVGKLLANIVGYLVMLVILFAVTVGSYLAYTDYSLSEALHEISILYGGILFVGFIFLLFGFFLSAILPSSRQSASVSLGVVFGTFIMGIISVLVPKLDFLIYLSPLDWIKTNKLLEEGLGTGELILGLGIMVCSIVATLFIYQKKDFRV